MAWTTTTYTTYRDHVSEPVVLCPRPLARSAGVLLLVPLLPKPAPLKPLPSEVWSRVIWIAIGVADGDSDNRRAATAFKWDLPLVCKQFKDVALPLLYSECTFTKLSTLKAFTEVLHSSEKRWDCIRRIRYSTPGRWVQTLNLSNLVLSSRSEVYAADGLLSHLFILLPFLAQLELSLSLQLSRRAMSALGMRETAHHLRVLKSVKYDSVLSVTTQTIAGYDDPLTSLIANLECLEELEVIGPGLDDLDLAFSASASNAASLNAADAPLPPPLSLPRLHTLTLLSTPSSDLLHRLIYSPLPALRNVVITPYGELDPPASHVARFLRVHGTRLRTLVLHTPKAWPTVLYPPPATLLQMLPNLTALSLELPFPPLEVPTPTATPPTPAPTPVETPATSHNPSLYNSLHSRISRTNVSSQLSSSLSYPLKSLWIPRPTAQFRVLLERLLPHLPRLREVRARNVRWARPGMSPRAMEAGFQGEMRAWRRMLAARGVKMLDAEGKGA